ncbi:MAG: lipoprotein-releasing ABC transporter permease subunit [Alphaproteobacteria bacterium]
MFRAFEWMMAGRYLRPRREQGFVSIIAGFSLLGIALGVATLIVVMAIMNGFRHELLNRVLGLNGHVAIYGEAGRLADYQALVERIAGLEGVAQVSAVIHRQALAVGRGAVAGVQVRGIAARDIVSRPMLAANLSAGALDGFGDAKGVVLGAQLAKTLGLERGDKLTLIAPEGTATPFGTVPRYSRYSVAGTFAIGMFEYDNSIILMPFADAQVLFQLGETASAVEVVAREPEQLDRLNAEIAVLAEGRGRLMDWRQAFGGFFEMVKVQQNVMFLILALIVLVAAFNIVSSLTMLVNDKGADIAILRTMGATPGAVMRIFLIVGASVGVLGTGLGLVLGLVITANLESVRGAVQRLIGTDIFNPEVYFLSELPARLATAEVATVVILALALSCLAAIYPSWRAARLDPVAALRYE